MVGGSYGGGIQFVTAADDCRVDAIVPIVGWHSLQTSLYKADTVKSGWSDLLSAATAGALDRPAHHQRPRSRARPPGTLSDEDERLVRSTGVPATWSRKIDVPTLIVQGTVDTLFTLDEGVTNYGLIRDAGRARRR